LDGQLTFSVSPSGSAEDIDLGAVFGYDGRVTFWCDVSVGNVDPTTMSWRRFTSVSWRTCVGNAAGFWPGPC